jgi:two-component system, chemotaxis family, protein-glutamate methylesterase/glutaminase
MNKRNIIVMGASSGGVDAFKKVIAGLPPDLDAAIFIVWHISPDTTGVLPSVLNKLGSLPASNAKDFDQIKAGHIYVAPPDKHLLLEGDHVRVTKGPKENRFRPAVDPLFRSAAYHFGNRVIGVVLSGALDDGTSGLWTIKERGGITIVQDPVDAMVPDMPLNALKAVNIDYTLPAVEIGPLLVELSSERIKEIKYRNNEENKKTEMELQVASQDNPNNTFFELGKLSPFSCPDCKGVMGIIKDGNLIRYRCHTGHAYTADTLLAAITEKTENTLWNVMREMQETVMMLNHIGDHFAENNHPHEAAKYFQKAKEALQRLEQVRTLLLEHEKMNKDEIEADNKERKPKNPAHQ